MHATPERGVTAAWRERDGLRTPLQVAPGVDAAHVADAHAQLEVADGAVDHVRSRPGQRRQVDAAVEHEARAVEERAIDAALAHFRGEAESWHTVAEQLAAEQRDDCIHRALAGVRGLRLHAALQAWRWTAWKLDVGR